MPAARRFHFALGPVLRQREREEREKQRAHSELVRRQMAIENTLRDIHAQIEAGKEDLGDRLNGRVDTEAIRAQANMTMALDMRARQCAIELAEVYRQVEQARKELIEASTRRKSIERLRERRYERWRAERNRDEARESDDLIMTRLANRGEDLA